VALSAFEFIQDVLWEKMFEPFDLNFYNIDSSMARKFFGIKRG